MLVASSNINKHSKTHARDMQLYSEQLSNTALWKWRMQSIVNVSSCLCKRFELMWNKKMSSLLYKCLQALVCFYFFIFLIFHLKLFPWFLLLFFLNGSFGLRWVSLTFYFHFFKFYFNFRFCFYLLLFNLILPYFYLHLINFFSYGSYGPPHHSISTGSLN